MEHDHRAEAVAEGFFFECGCGEIHRTSAGAWTCRKCREYLMDADFDDREVFDLRTGKPVARDW